MKHFLTENGVSINLEHLAQEVLRPTVKCVSLFYLSTIINDLKSILWLWVWKGTPWGDIRISRKIAGRSGTLRFSIELMN
jgi:hypothetical protein